MLARIGASAARRSDWTWRRDAILRLAPCAAGLSFVLLALSIAAAQPPGLPLPAPGGPLAAPQPALSAPVPQLGIVPSTDDLLRALLGDHGFCLAIGEEFARSFVAQETCDEGPVQDCVLGAQVSGSQKTRAAVSIDFVPHPTAARFLVVLDGVTTNQTISQTSQARIHTRGNYRFQLTKQAEFDGVQFQTWSPAAYLTVEQRHLGAQTPVSTVPLLGPLANAAALSAAEQRRPLSERIAAQRVTDHVAPRFNTEFDMQLARFNRALANGLRPKLAEWNVEPRSVSARSTDNALLIAAAFRPQPLPATPLEHAPQYRPADAPHALPRMLAPEEVPVETLEDAPLFDEIEPIPGTQPLRLPDAQRAFTLPVSTRTGGEDSMPVPWSTRRLPQPGAAVASQLTAMLHESVLGDLASRSTLAGLALPDTALKRLFQWNDADRSEPAAPGLATIVFSREEPVTSTISQGELLLHVRVAFQPILGPEIPQQVITLAVQPALEATEVRIHFEFRSMRPADPREESGLAGAAAEDVVRKAVESLLRDVTLPRELQLPREPPQTPFPARVAQLSLEDGWLMVALEPVRTLPIGPMHSLPVEPMRSAPVEPTPAR